MRNTGHFFLFIALAVTIPIFSSDTAHSNKTPTVSKQAAMFLTVPTVSAKPKTAPKAAVSPAEEIKIIDFDESEEFPLMRRVISASPKIIRDDDNDYGYGTGFLFTDNGLIVTDLHVVKQRDIVTVKFYEIKKDDPNLLRECLATTGKVIQRSDKELDLAFIKADKIPDGVEPLVFSIGEKTDNEAEPVWRFGFGPRYRWASGLYFPNDYYSLTPERHSILMPIEPGASGGPIVNGFGEVIGITQLYQAGKNRVVTIDQKWLCKNKYEQSAAIFLPVEAIVKFLCKHPIQ